MEAGLAPSPPKSVSCHLPLHNPSPGAASASGEVPHQGDFWTTPCPFVWGLVAGMLLSPRMPAWTCLVEALGKECQEQKPGCRCREVGDYLPRGSQGRTPRREVGMSGHRASPPCPSPALATGTFCCPTASGETAPPLLLGRKRAFWGLNTELSAWPEGAVHRGQPLELLSPVRASRSPPPGRRCHRPRCPERDKGWRGTTITAAGNQQPSIFMRLQRTQAFKYSSGRQRQEADGASRKGKKNAEKGASSHPCPP